MLSEEPETAGFDFGETRRGGRCEILEPPAYLAVNLLVGRPIRVVAGNQATGRFLGQPGVAADRQTSVDRPRTR